MRVLLLGAVFALCGAAGGLAQSAPQVLPDQPARTYDVKTMTFDLWCQETQHYPTDRCAKRQAADVMAFQNYRDAVERYELQYLQQQDQQRAVESRVNRDPTQTERSKQDRPVQ